MGTLCLYFFCSGGNDEFADFNSAFSESVTLSSNTSGSSSQHFSSGTFNSQTPVLSSNVNIGKNYYDLYCIAVVVVCKYMTSSSNKLCVSEYT